MTAGRGGEGWAGVLSIAGEAAAAPGANLEEAAASTSGVMGAKSAPPCSREEAFIMMSVQSWC